jgi:hypothetical protein
MTVNGDVEATGNISAAGNLITFTDLIFEVGGTHQAVISAGNTTAARIAHLPDLDGTIVVDVYDNDIEINDPTKGIILQSPDTTRWRITVDNSGSLVTTIA